MDNSTPDMSEKLIDYLDGSLSGTELETVEKLLATDETLRKSLDELKAAREAVKLYGLQQQVSAVHSEMMKEQNYSTRKINSTHRLLRYSIAVAASLLLIVAVYTGYNFYSLSSERVYAAQYRSFELNTLRDGSTDEGEIEKAYREKKYSVITTLQFERPYSINELFLRAMAYAELGDNTNAITNFRKVIEDNKQTKSSIFKDEAEYYLALTYIRNKDFDFAIDMLKDIKNSPDHYYKQKVTSKLIRQVKLLKWR
jgi:tetratricopeptide (TPR) repeat protein